VLKEDTSVVHKIYLQVEKDKKKRSKEYTLESLITCFLFIEKVAKQDQRKKRKCSLSRTTTLETEKETSSLLLMTVQFIFHKSYEKYK
jgi:predicted nucleic acid-binding protein